MVMKKNYHFANLFVDPLDNHLGIMNSAITKGLFDGCLSCSVSEMLAPYHEISRMQSALSALGTLLSLLSKTDIFSMIQLMANKMATYSVDMIHQRWQQHWVPWRILFL